MAARPLLVNTTLGLIEDTGQVRLARAAEGCPAEEWQAGQAVEGDVGARHRDRPRT